MDIEKRLNYLIQKRAELQKTIAELQKERLGLNTAFSEREKANGGVSGEVTVLELDSNCIFEQVNHSKNRQIKTGKKEDSVFIEASKRLNSHAYVYFPDMWRIAEIADGETMSVMAESDDDTEVRPLVVFYDQLRRKISHTFFMFNTPIRIEVPGNTNYVTFGLRFEAGMKVMLHAFRFHVQTLQEVCDMSFMNRIQDKINLIPESNGGRYYIPYDKPFGLIADQFLYDAYKDVGKCIYITPDNYREELGDLSFLVVASAWHGLENEWDNMTKPDSEQGKAIFEIIKEAKELNIPVVFYSKEDPPNYEHFLHIAKECDYIFTSASEMIEHYKEDCNNVNVDSLCFGINPILHNPVGIHSVEPEDGVVFSGSWMAKYPERIRSLETMFDGILDSQTPLKIIDRNFDKNDPRYFFPQKYYRCISPAVDHETLQKVHKLYKWAININSVTDSSTMFANRVYELQAIGNILISNYSKGVVEKFEGVHIVETEDEVGRLLTSMNDEELYYERIKNIRRVMTGETTYDRLSQIINTINLNAPKNMRKVAVIVSRNNAHLVEDFNKQSYQDKALLYEDEIKEEMLEDVDIVSFWDKNFQYGEYYLEDMINAFKYTSCSYITKDSFYEKGELVSGIEHDYVDRYISKYATVFWKSDYSFDNLTNMPIEGELPNGYSIDHFELIRGERNT